MSYSLKNIPKISKLLDKKDMIIQEEIKREESTEKLKENLNLKYLFYKNTEKIKTKDLCILNFITNDKEKNYSGKTLLSDSPPDLTKYESSMINKYNENLNSSLSFISDFNLEGNENELNDSFNSSDDDFKDIEQIEIKSKSSKNLYNRKFDDEINIELEKEWKDIKDILLNKRLSK